MSPTRDELVRSRAFLWLADQVRVHGDVLDWSLLCKGFDLDGQRVPLCSQQGIFKPAACEWPLSIRTSPESPYDDRFLDDQLVYSYRGNDPAHRENLGLRRLMELRRPLVHLHGVVEGRYLVTWPVYVVGDEPARLQFLIQVDACRFELAGASLTGSLEGASIGAETPRRRYATRLVQQRLHQRGFRERVLAAYQEQCAMCRLKHRNLLDAAHIKPDSDGGLPVIPNGLSLCGIHHKAFDVGVLGVNHEDLSIHVRRDVREEIDGPMLRHGLQSLHGERIWTPAARGHKPDTELLRWKWERFQEAG